jgi:hypothetical protein
MDLEVSLAFGAVALPTKKAVVRRNRYGELNRIHFDFGRKIETADNDSLPKVMREITGANSYRKLAIKSG